MNNLLIFLKEPKKGRVKTRIAKTMGDEKAYNIYCTFLKKIASSVVALDAKVSIFFDSLSSDCPILKSIFGEDKPYYPQQGLSLGDKLKQGFSLCFDNNPNSSYIVIGGDSPNLPLNFLEEGFVELSKKDVVVGSTKDGGYYALGLSSFLPQVFENISWGKETVFEETIQCIKENQFSYSCLPSWYDIDTEQDYKKFLKNDD